MVLRLIFEGDCLHDPLLNQCVVPDHGDVLQAILLAAKITLFDTEIIYREEDFYNKNNF